MKSATNAILYNGIWFVAVWRAAAGDMWSGPLAMGLFLLLHLSWTPGPQRRLELGFLLAAGVVGSLADTGLHRMGFIDYPTSQEVWAYAIVPPWITCLWVGFASMPRFSLRWLGGFPWVLASVFGALGGSLAFFGGTRFGAIEAGMGSLTYFALAVEYALLTPILVFGHRRLRTG